MPLTNETRQPIEALETMSDEALIALYREGENNAIDLLVQRYKKLVRNKIRVNFFVGADKDDLIQEGMIGLFKAICDYNPEKEASFKSFATLCVTRQISTAFRAVSRQKHIPLNRSVSLSVPIGKSSDEEDEGITLMDVIKNNVLPTPEEEVISKENVEDINDYIVKSLSDLEIEVLHLYMEGKNYKEIAKLLDKTPKSIDNALQRIKKKLEGVKR
ncbi:MAG: RNA polymerase sporulation sigma factor SigH [Candidatus Cellulosilyticum pullistercoris]|uniref:RNA polymerase sporulation sigma factor SigH n=1 Tax=Candidatus Cellulosilyticum pullistercoris TaxID=2838521 RepID=A0A9E2KCF1_9FIRM|nr:RNA polymerase sporulation sigma factor SigH [Candidatus Cellulosilyticum pullistercoris]